jgi:hypothetical protein
VEPQGAVMDWVGLNTGTKGRADEPLVPVHFNLRLGLMLDNEQIAVSPVETNRIPTSQPFLKVKWHHDEDCPNHADDR